MSMKSVCKYAIRSLRTCADSQLTEDHRCRDMESFMAMDFTIPVCAKQILTDSIMTHLQLYIEPS